VLKAEAVEEVGTGGTPDATSLSRKGKGTPTAKRGAVARKAETVEVSRWQADEDVSAKNHRMARTTEDPEFGSLITRRGTSLIVRLVPIPLGFFTLVFMLSAVVNWLGVKAAQFRTTSAGPLRP
jgi:hypothetical protein